MLNEIKKSTRIRIHPISLANPVSEVMVFTDNRDSGTGDATAEMTIFIACNYSMFAADHRAPRRSWDILVVVFHSTSDNRDSHPQMDFLALFLHSGLRFPLWCTG